MMKLEQTFNLTLSYRLISHKKLNKDFNRWFLNPLTSMSDQDTTSPYVINTKADKL